MAAKKLSVSRATKASAQPKPIVKKARTSVEKPPRTRLAASAGKGRSTRKTPIESAAAKPASKGARPKARVEPAARTARNSTSKEPGVPSSLPGEGDRAPRFALLDHRGEPVSSEALAGRPYVLYFYPKDDTPGCTVEACGFRDAVTEFEEAGVRVIGVSPDSAASHQKFIAKHDLPFTLLCDGEHELAIAYGTWALKKNYGREYMGIVRSTFLIAADGTIEKAWRSVRVNGHVAAVQAAAQQLS